MAKEFGAATKNSLYPITPAVETNPDLAKEIEEIIGYLGVWEKACSTSTYRVTISIVTAMGAAIPGYMGMNTPLNFQLEGNNAAINGDFILRPAICWMKSRG